MLLLYDDDLELFFSVYSFNFFIYFSYNYYFQGAGTSQTVFKGNKKPTSKECVLIIDHDTGTYTLEKLDQNVFVKKTR